MVSAPSRDIRKEAPGAAKLLNPLQPEAEQVGQSQIGRGHGQMVSKVMAMIHLVPRKGGYSSPRPIVKTETLTI